jgi:hypothetical protein
MRSAEHRLHQRLEATQASLAKPSYRCVKIESGPNACQAIQVYQTKPILVNDAPRLPLVGCNVMQCGCKFIRFDDRRTGNDRRNQSAQEAENARIYADKRIRSDRRKASIQDFLNRSTRHLSNSL